MTNQDYHRVTHTAEKREELHAHRWLSRGLAKEHFGKIGDRMTVVTELLSAAPWPPTRPPEGTRGLNRFEFLAVTGELLRYSEEYPGEFDPIRIIHGDWYTLDLIVISHSPESVLLHAGTAREYVRPITSIYTMVRILAMRHSPRYEAPWDKAY